MEEGTFLRLVSTDGKSSWTFKGPRRTCLNSSAKPSVRCWAICNVERMSTTSWVQVGSRRAPRTPRIKVTSFHTVKGAQWTRKSSAASVNRRSGGVSNCHTSKDTSANSSVSKSVLETEEYNQLDNQTDVKRRAAARSAARTARRVQEFLARVKC